MRRSTAKATVILACYNGAATLSTQLEALSRQRWSQPWELIISDNGSTDESLRIVEQYRCRVANLRAIDSSRRQGVAHARNVAIAAAASDRLIFCDADDEVAPRWLAVMAEGLAQHPVVVSRFDDGKLNPQWLRDLWNTSTEGPAPCLGYLPCAAGYGLGFTREVYERVGPFDESLMRMSDIDFTWRLQLAGYQLDFLTEAVVQYRHRPTLRGMFSQAYRDGQAQVLLYKKYAKEGMPWRSWTGAIRAWIALGKRMPLFHSKVERARWMVDLGFMLGHVRGSIRHDMLAL